jgi:membrane spanning protein
METGKERLVNLKKFLCNLVLSLIAFILTGLGTSMSIEGAIGISSFNALNYSLSSLFQMKIGTMTIILNLLFLFLYIVLTNEKFIMKYIFQLIAISSIGIVINFFTYNIFDKMEVGNYFISVMYLVSGVLIGGISVAFILALDTMSFPVEAFCLEIANMKNIKFSKVRRLIDIISVSVSLLITLLFSYPLVIREGTVVSLLLFSTVIGYFHEKFIKIEAIRNLKIFI